MSSGTQADLGTRHLFDQPGPVTTPDEAERLRRPSRWRLHRGGIVNIWQYSNRTFDFEGGRAVFQGTNGSGKSRTLELLLPLCLDGDLRQVGAEGFDTVSLRRLMLDEYAGGPNRIGYAWVELRRQLDTGTAEEPTEEFLTCGVGVKAAAAARQISDSWRFVTTRRVGRDLELLGPGEVPLGPTQLREELGAECLLDEETFRARIAADVYGVPAARYGDLLHLQRTLRNPDVGMKVREGQLERILSDALPPLEPGLVERLAGSFEDLESIRENLLRLSRADEALSAFMRTYSRYALDTLWQRARTMRDAQDKLRGLGAEVDRGDRESQQARQQRCTAEQAVADLQRRERELEASLRALRAGAAYTGSRQLHDRQALVESARSAAVTALTAASTHRAHEQRSTERMLGQLGRLSGDAEAARQSAEHVRTHLHTAGLDGSLLPPIPAIPAGQATVDLEQVRSSPEAGAEPLGVERHTPPRLDGEELATRLRHVVDRCARVDAVVQQQSALVLALHQRSTRLDGEQAEVAEARKVARQAQLTATGTAARRNQSRQELSATATEWAERARNWRHQARELVLDPVDDCPEPPSLTRLSADRSAARRAAERAREWARPHLRRARALVTEAEREIATLHTATETREDELAGLRGGEVEYPQPAAWSATEQDTEVGTGFHRLVDFAEDLTGSDRAGLEAALEASGLLGAWVGGDGVATEPHTQRLVAAPGPCPPGSTLADLLVAAAPPGCPVSTERIEALLASVPLDATGPGLSVSVTGHWRAGVLSGTHRKDAAEHIGAGAREAARIRRIARLEEELAELRVETGQAEKRHREATEHVKSFEQHAEAYPEDGELLTAHVNAANATDAAQDAEREAARLRKAHDEAEQRRQAAHADLARSAGEAGLTARTQSLDAAHRAAAEARDAIGALRELVETRCLAELEEFRQAGLHHDANVADRMAAESQAEQRCTGYLEQSAGLEELAAAAGDQGRDTAQHAAELEGEHADTRERLTHAREEVAAARERVAEIRARQESARRQLAEYSTEAETAASDFEQVRAIPGLWSAAMDSDERQPVPEETEQAAEAVAAHARQQPGSAVSETEVITRIQALQQGLSGNHDVTTDHGRGALAVTITGEEGPLPVAEAAREIAERLERQRGYLNERYRAVFADYLIRDLAERLRGQIAVADNLCERMNEVLEGARSSQGVHVQLQWRPSPALSDDLRRALELVRTPFAERTDEQDALLRGVFTELIESQRESTAGGYADILSRALDYRTWFDFTVRVHDTDPDGSARVRRLRQLSSGETRLVSYVTLFAAAAAFYDAITISSSGQGPLRLVLLDEAFERLDDPTVARMLGLLVDLDMDWVITWPSGWGVSPKIPTMHIYDVLRPRSGHGIACTHTVWNGRGLEQAER